MTSAFADVVSVQSRFEFYELPEIFAAPEDNGENDAARDLVRLDAEHLAQAFAAGRIPTFARLLGGGEITAIKPYLWEIDDVLPRFATGAFNLERWADLDAPLTHRIFVESEAFDRWLAALKPLGPLTDRQVDEIVDPRLRAARAVAARNVSAEKTTDEADTRTVSGLADPPGVGPVLLTIGEVSKLVRRSQSTIYEDEKKGTFPQRLKLGSSSRWKKTEVLAWIEEQAAKRGGL